ncbi:ABC transporter ATP-binding protein [Sulfitobacter albidus]|uniref:ABC transporter ATP-binding protein n=1 Tax=Sulfitobacter albidus TaxID=2829501 RepID=A0A975JEE2_9RHOB|nr:ABC transporter ATP-binding protein [Sulfitobacter albidus]QUJ76812.1 ABC transporter ATP-binding protein [Sulfitobacter albidus]
MRLPRIFDGKRGRDIAFVAALGVAQAALMMVAAFATRVVFSALAQGDPFPASAVAALVAVPLCLAFVQAMARVLAETIGQSFAVDLRDTVFRAIAALPEAERSKRSLGGLSLRFVGDMAAARGWAGLGVTRLISGVIVLPIAAFTLWLLNPALALAGIAPIGMAMVLFVVIGRRLHRVHKNLRRRRAHVAIWAMERIDKAHELAAMGRLNRETGQLRKRGQRAAADAVTRIRTTSMLRMIPNASLGVGSAAVMMAALFLGLPTGETAAALAVLAILTIPLRQLVGVWDKHAAWKVARSKVEILIARADYRKIQPRTRIPLGVQLTHPEWEAPIEIAAGRAQTLPARVDWRGCLDALCGKTSEVRAGFEDGANPEVAVISPDPVILKGSLRRALTIGADKRPSDDALRDLIRGPAFDGFIQTDLDQRLAEAGKGLADTALLRIALIQAITRTPSIIVVEAAFWMDPAADALWEILRARSTSTVIAAPRHDTVLNYDNAA